MIYTIITRQVFAIGKGWMNQDMAYEYTLPRSVPATRADIRTWLDVNSWDFQRIIDFAASIAEIEIPWDTEAAEWAYHDLTFPDSF